MTFQCISFGHGNPRIYTYTWKKHGTIITNVADDRKDTLVFLMTSEAEGNYSCIAKNDYGETDESLPEQMLFKAGIPPPEGTSSIKNLQTYFYKTPR